MAYKDNKRSKGLQKLIFQHFIEICLISTFMQLHIYPPDAQCDVMCKGSINVSKSVKNLKVVDVLRVCCKTKSAFI